jgi:hypothetical protein
MTEAADPGAASVDTFDLDPIVALRDRAVAARNVSPGARDGWSKSDVDPEDLLGVFDTLRLRPGFVLRAYRYVAGRNGNGIVYALPAEPRAPASPSASASTANEKMAERGGSPSMWVSVRDESFSDPFRGRRSR